MKPLIIAALLSASCHKPTEFADNEPAAAPRYATAAARSTRAASAAAPIKPSDRAKQLLAVQLATLSSHDEGDDAIVATFAKDAIVLVPDARAVANPTIGLRAAIIKLTPHETLKSSKIAKIAAGGNDSAVWLSAELELAVFDGEPEQKPSIELRRVRITELATAEADWKVVAAAATIATAPIPSKEAPETIAGATDAGPLAALLTSPTALNQALSTDPSVGAFGTDDKETALGPAAARAMLAKWKALNLSIEGKPREAHGKMWGYVQANVNWQKPGKPFPARMSAILIAVPTADGNWSVVAVQYGAQ